MIMELHEPRTITQAVDLLSHGDDTMCLAGGASLVAMMNAELVSPAALVSLRHIEELAGIVPSADGGVHIGAMSVHDTIARSAEFRGGQSVIAQAASRIGHPAIRNMGTIGGAVSLADPAADFPPALVAAGAEIEVVGPSGERRIPATEFFHGYFETALAQDEIVTAVVVPKAPTESGASFVKFARVDGDYATVSVAAVLAMEGGVCRYARIVVGACGPVPVHLDAADAMLVGNALNPETIGAAGLAIAEVSRPVDDVRGTAAYRRKLIPKLVQRAVDQARGQIGKPI